MGVQVNVFVEQLLAGGLGRAVNTFDEDALRVDQGDPLARPLVGRFLDSGVDALIGAEP